MKRLICLVVIGVASCNMQYDGEIVVLRNGKVVQLKHHIGETYIIEELDSAQVTRAAAELMRSTTK